MLNPDKRNIPQNILSAWTALEVLSPQSFNHPKELAARKNIKLVVSLEDEKLPWEIPTDDVDGKTLYYQVILGTIDNKNAIFKLCNVYADRREEKPNAKAEALLAVIVVDKNGCPIDKSDPAVSSFAWALPKALDKKLDKLNKWIEEEQSVVIGLTSILHKTGEKDELLPLTRTTLDQAYEYLVTRFELSADLVKKGRFAIKAYMYSKNLDPLDPLAHMPSKNSDPPDPLLLNSFFLNDLYCAEQLFASDQATKNLKKYLAIDTIKERSDLLKDNKALEKAVAPNLIPPARWPGAGRHPLMLLQQAAVNLSMKELKDGGILAVNGPPGTGKTTLLRDIVAAIVTQRAEVMCSYDDPEKAFRNSGVRLQVSSSVYLKMHTLDDKLKGFEILIASSNNKAVENVSAELPTIKAIAGDAPDLRYLTSLSDKLLQNESWGLIAAVLGNNSNRSRFRKIFWWDKDVGLLTYLAEVVGMPQWIAGLDPSGNKITKKPKIIELEQPPITHREALQRWHNAKYEFQKTLKNSRSELANLEEIRQAPSKLPALLESISDIKKHLEQEGLLLDAINAEYKAAKLELGHIKEALQEAELNFTNHRYLKPNWFELLFNIGDARSWRQRASILLTRNNEVKNCYKDQNNIVNDVEKKLSRKQSLIQKIENQLLAAQKNYTEIKEKALGPTTKSGHVIDEEFFSQSHEAKHEAMHQTSPWCDANMHRLRDDVFIAAVKLHKAFIDAAAKPLRHNLGALMNVFSGSSTLNSEQQLLLPDLWSSLFLAVPSISTTFASAGSMLSKLRPESLGWLLVDEAGQAIPQAAVGAILRTKRALVVGDPMQIEPVVTLPPRLTKAICKYFDVDAGRFNAPEASVQTLADAATPYFAEFDAKNGNREVGIPLLVHRRCSDPMFTIANVIAYGGLMIQAKREGKSAIRDCLGPSAWINIQGKAQDKWCPEEGKKVLELLRQLKSASIAPDLYIVTPFTIVADNLRDYIEKSGIMQYWVDKPEDWLEEHVGTVHTAQGREAEAVIFVLGATAQDQDGARNWAGKHPNLLNVAVTRAKEVLYIIGNYDLWSEEGVFSEVANRLTETVHYKPSQDPITAYNYNN